MPGSANSFTRGLLDTNVLILWEHLEPTELPDQAAISAVTLAELSAGVHMVADDDPSERARRLAVLQRAEHGFRPIPFDAQAARVFGQLSSAVLSAGRSPRSRTADLMIASVAVANGLALFTANPSDFAGLQDHLHLMPVTRPVWPK